MEPNEEREWFVVRTKPRREAFAQSQLARRGVETFFPRIVEATGGSTDPAAGPLFPNYLFALIRLEAQYGSVIWAPGVKNLVGFGDAPIPVDPQVIGFIRARCGVEGIVRAEPSIHDGDWVRVRRGPLEGLVGVVQGDVNGQYRVQILMEILRRRTLVSVPVAMLERTDSLGEVHRRGVLTAQPAIYSAARQSARLAAA